MAEPPEEPPEGPPEEPPEGPSEGPPEEPSEGPPEGPLEGPPEGPLEGASDELPEELWDGLSDEQWEETPDERWGEPELRSPAELARRRAEERAAHRRVGRQRLLVLLAGVVALVVIIVLVTSGGGSPTPSNTTPGATKAAGTGSGVGHLAAGSDTAALPTNILIADRNNNRLVVVSPLGRVVWSSPEPSPSDAYFSATGRSIVVTQHANAVVLLRGVDSGRIDYSYGHPNAPGSGDDRLRDPQTGHLTAAGQIVIADLGNCRILFIRKPSHIPVSHLGTGPCVHAPPASFAGPDAAFPTSDGGLVVTERNPGWIDVLSKAGKVVSQTRLASFSQPYDANEYAPGKLIVTDRTHPGTVEELSAATGSATAGKVIWSYSPKSGSGELKGPTLAIVLANGDVLVADSLNDRVIVIDPKTNKIVWQYGHTAAPGSSVGYLHTPESVDLLP
jgi:DNA-binding beta-propeller fold protein YncE